MLTPIESETRERKILDGLWDFARDAHHDGECRGWHAGPFPGSAKMPVPASYNDLTQDPALRDHVGAVWYQTQVWVPKGWEEDDVELHIGAAGNLATVWWDGEQVAAHRGAFLPFLVPLGARAGSGLHRLVICVDNLLTFSDLPTGNLVPAGKKRPGYSGTRQQLESFHDFYNYAGIHRSVQLLRLPRRRVEAIRVEPGLEAGHGTLAWEAETRGEGRLTVTLHDAEGREAARGEGRNGVLKIDDVHPWAPGAPYLYTLTCDLWDGETLLDRYRLPVGIRTAGVTKDQFLLNGQPFYFRGLGKHEDSPLLGRAHSPAVLAKDLGLLDWLGANSFRASHYPYDEEWLYEADRRGIAVIAEVPAVGFNPWNENVAWFAEGKVDGRTLANHLADLEAMIARDGNHPCIVAWNLFVEAPTHEPGALPYAEALVRRARQLDASRPLTFEQSSRAEACRVQQLADFVSLSRYYGWYENMGDLDPQVVQECLLHELDTWRERFGQPVFMLEYGADAVAGMHSDPPVMFSEEYQVETLRLVGEALDQRPWIIGEHVWNLADFATKQGLNRVMGNKKGVFTRERQPKMGAHFLRNRWAATDATGRPIPTSAETHPRPA